MAETRFVRLKPYDKRRGFLMRRYSVNRKRFTAGRWYEVPLGLAMHLENITAKPEDPTTPLAFDVVDTKQDAQRLMKRERMARERATAENPELMTLTTRDLRGDEIREVDISADDEVEQRPRRRQDPMRNEKMSDAEALAMLDDGSDPVRTHVIDETPDSDPEPPARRTRRKPATKKPAAKKAATKANKPAAKKPAKTKKPRAKTKTTRAAAKSSKGKAASAMPAELDAANWADGDEAAGAEIDPFS